MGSLNELIIRISKSLGEFFAERLLLLIKSKAKEIIPQEVACLVGKTLRWFWKTQRQKLASVFRNKILNAGEPLQLRDLLFKSMINTQTVS